MEENSKNLSFPQKQVMAKNKDKTNPLWGGRFGEGASSLTRSYTASIDIDKERFPRVGDFYKSADYETAANKVDINADFGAGSLSIR